MTSTQEFRIKTKIAIAGGNDELAKQYAISLVRAVRRARKNLTARAMNQARRDCGLVSGRDSAGRRIWE